MSIKPAPPDQTALSGPPHAHLRLAHRIGRSFRYGINAERTGDPRAWSFVWQEWADATSSSAEADHLLTHLAAFVGDVGRTAARPIDVLPHGCPGLCRDECLAVSIVAASQLGACPALKACAFALLESSNLAPCLQSAAEFGGALRAAGHVLNADHVLNALAMAPQRWPRIRTDA